VNDIVARYFRFRFSLDLAGNQEQLPFSMREESNISSTGADAAADVVG
jgi:hypothetical protein